MSRAHARPSAGGVLGGLGIVADHTSLAAFAIHTGGAMAQAICRPPTSRAITARPPRNWARRAVATLALLLPLVASEARAGIAFVKNIGTANSGTATTTSITVPAAGVAAGNSIILTFASADAGTTYSAMDSAGNMYAVDIQGAKAGSVRTVILSAHNVQALVSGNTITLSHPSLPGTAKRGLSADEFSGLAKTGTFDQSQTGNSSGTAADSGATATTAQAAELLIGAIGDDGALNDGFTAGDDGQGGTYTVNASSRAGAGGTGAFTINPEYEIVAAAKAYRAKGTIGASHNWAANIATYKADANCGNGTVDTGEDCDQAASNGTPGSCCSAACRFVPAATVCRAATNECDLAETCPGNSGSCPADTVKTAGTACTSDGNVCTPDVCNGTVGAPACTHLAGNAGTVCRAAAGVCDAAETCDGSSTACPPDAKQPVGTACTADSNPCTLDQCDGASNACQHPAGNAGAVCRAAVNECDVAETCTGSSTSCPANAVKSAGTACTDDGNACTTDVCNGSTSSPACTHPAGNAGAACPDDGDPCTTDTCDGTSTSCQHAPGNAGTVCRAAANACDVAETCPGAIIIAFHGAATASGAASLSISRPSGTATNDVMVASIIAHGSSVPTITPPTGWTLIVNTTSNGQSLAESTYWKVAGTAGADAGPYVFTASSASSLSVAGGISAYFNVDTANPINASGGSASSSAPSITTTVANTMLVAGFGRSSNSPIGMPSGMTERFHVESSSGSTAAAESAEESQATAGVTGAKTSTGNTAQVSQLIALAPPSSSCPADTVKAAGTSCTDDGNACTTDVCNGTVGAPACTHPNKPNGTACDDGVACTVTDVCTGGVCAGTPNNALCSDGNVCTDDVCTIGVGCSNPPKANGTACNDGNACTQTDMCEGGTCTGSNPVTCTAPDQCHDAGTCNPATGMCSNPAKPDGTACNDGDACTQTDRCESGTCTGSNPVTCTAPDQCHDAGTCNPATGTCSSPAQPDGTVCNDGNACTTADTCQAGVCTGGSAEPDGVPCDDGNSCTSDDACVSGVCAGTAVADGTTCNAGTH